MGKSIKIGILAPKKFTINLFIKSLCHKILGTDIFREEINFMTREERGG